MNVESSTGRKDIPLRNYAASEIENLLHVAMQLIRPGKRWINGTKPRSSIDIDAVVEALLKYPRQLRADSALREIGITCPYWFARVAIIRGSSGALEQSKYEWENVDEDKLDRDGPTTTAKRARAAREGIEALVARRDVLMGLKIEPSLSGEGDGLIFAFWEEKMKSLNAAIDVLREVEKFALQAATASRKTKSTFFDRWSVNFAEFQILTWTCLTGRLPSLRTNSPFLQFIEASGDVLGLHGKNWEHHARKAFDRMKDRECELLQSTTESVGQLAFPPQSPEQYEAEMAKQDDMSRAWSKAFQEIRNLKNHPFSLEGLEALPRDHEADRVALFGMMERVRQILNDR